MSKRFTPETRKKAVEEYLSGEKTAEELALELGTVSQTIYRWKAAHTENQKGIRLEEIMTVISFLVENFSHRNLPI